MGTWQALSCTSVREDHLREILDRRGIEWEAAAHVSATTSLAGALRQTRAAALPIATLIDCVVLPGVPGRRAPSLDGLPHGAVLSASGQADLSDWQQRATGYRIQSGIRFDDLLRGHCRDASLPDDVRRVLVGARRELSRTLVSLVAAGVRPDDLAPTDPVAEAARQAWIRIEANLPGFTAMRDDLWMDPSEFRAGTSQRASSLRSRISDALERIFDKPPETALHIVHHGFYFFTPPQWAFFHLLKQLPDVHQTFVVHDDGASDVYETWRRFFTEKWGMPRIERVGESRPVGRAATALSQAMHGEPVEADGAGESLRILRCASPTELVRDWRLSTMSVERGAPKPRMFAARAKDVERFMRRLGAEADAGKVDLAQLPIGIFLLAVHDSVDPQAVGPAPGVAFRPESLMDIVGSGFLEMGSPAEDIAMQLTTALRLAMPYFKGCRRGEDWLDRAAQLVTVMDQVRELEEPEAPINDLERWRKAAHSPLRLVPWTDLTREQAQLIKRAVDAAVALVQEVGRQERVSLRAHTEFISAKLRQGMSLLDPEDRRRIEAKVEGFSAGPDVEIDVEGLVDVVAMLLGREVDFETTDGDGTDYGVVSELRALDALGLAQSQTDVHVANLADGIFPSQVSEVGWPFRSEDLQASSTVEPVTKEILRTRAQDAALGDLYLLWLALNGTHHDKQVTLSYVADLGGEPQNPATPITLLAVPETRSEAIAAQAGGIPVSAGSPAAEMAPITARPEPSATPPAASVLDQSIAAIEPLAAASAEACQRRFALQWALGDSPAFSAEHHQIILYGNVAHALTRLHLTSSVLKAFAICNAVWQFLTPGQRRSSSTRSRVRPSGPTAHPWWILTLAGNKDGNEPLDRAYQSAKSAATPQTGTLVPTDAVFLPPGVDDPEICGVCPVALRCRTYVDSRERR